MSQYLYNGFRHDHSVCPLQGNPAHSFMSHHFWRACKLLTALPGTHFHRNLFINVGVIMIDNLLDRKPSGKRGTQRKKMKVT